MEDSALRQRREALIRANEARSFRAQMKRRIKAREATWGEVEGLILDPPPPIRRMPVSQFLLALPTVGQVKRNKVLRAMRIQTSTTLDSLTEKQRRELASLVSTWRRYLL